MISTYTILNFRFELEITDDEDQEDNLPWPVWAEKRGNNSKRFRPFEEELDTNMTDPNRRIITRASGISPNIEGLDRQPWQFNFRSKKSKQSNVSRSKFGYESLESVSSGSVELSRGTASFSAFFIPVDFCRKMHSRTVTIRIIVHIISGSLLRDATPSTSQQSSQKYLRSMERSVHPGSLRPSKELQNSRMESLSTDFSNFKFRKPSTIKVQGSDNYFNS